MAVCGEQPVDQPRPTSAAPATMSAGLRRQPPTAMVTALSDRMACMDRGMWAGT